MNDTQYLPTCFLREIYYECNRHENNSPSSTSLDFVEYKNYNGIKTCSTYYFHWYTFFL